MVPPPIRIMIADDHPIVRNGIISSLAEDPRLTVVAAAEHFQAVLRLLPTVHADVVVLDICDMGSSPISMVQRLTREYPYLGIIIFSSSVDVVPEMLQAGARGYVVKEEQTDELINAIYAVYMGQTFLSPSAQDYVDRHVMQSYQHHLAPHEVSVLKLLNRGMGTMAIAEYLAIDPRTVHNYIHRLRLKTGCDERTQLANWYRRVYGTTDTPEEVSD